MALRAARNVPYNQAVDIRVDTLSSFLSVNCSCDEGLAWLDRSLTRGGFRVLRTFDLHEARLGSEGCPCPQHGTQGCDCRMVVVLVYGEAAEPATLVLHGSEGRTWLSLVNNPGQPADPALRSAIEGALGQNPVQSGL